MGKIVNIVLSMNSVIASCIHCDIHDFSNLINTPSKPGNLKLSFNGKSVAFLGGVKCVC